MTTNSLDSLHDDFCVYAELERNLSPKTIRWYKETFVSFKKFLSEKEFIQGSLENLNTRNIKQYLYDAKRSRNKTTTVYSLKILQIEIFWNWLIRIY